MQMNSPPNLFDAFLDPVFTPDLAAQIVDRSIDPVVGDRLNELRERANEGALTEADRQEYEAFIEQMDMIALIKAKARAVLAHQDSAS